MAKSKGCGLFLGVLALAAAGFIVYQMLGPQRSDAVLIKEALAESIEAGKEGRPGGVLELLSNEFKINDQVIASFRDIARVVRDYKPDVEVLTQTPEVDGDTATIISAVKIKTGFPLNQDFTIPDVRMEFRKESGTKWIFVPAKSWKLHRVRLSESFLSGFAGF